MFGLEDRVKGLEETIQDEDVSNAELKILEDEVARTVAQVNTAEDEVSFHTFTPGNSNNFNAKQIKPPELGDHWYRAYW